MARKLIKPRVIWSQIICPSELNGAILQAVFAFSATICAFSIEYQLSEAIIAVKRTEMMINLLK